MKTGLPLIHGYTYVRFIDLAAKLAGLWCTVYIKYRPNEYKIATCSMNDIKTEIKYYKRVLKFAAFYFTVFKSLVLCFEIRKKNLES